MKGVNNLDFAEADRLAGFNPSNPRPADYTWHHHQDGKTMMLVPKNINTPPSGISHIGGAAIIKHNKANPSNTLYFPSPKFN